MALSGITSAESTSSQASATVTAVNLPAAASETASNNSRAAAGSATVFDTVDTVTLQNKSQKAGSESSAEKAEKKENSQNNATRSVSDVLFDYNARGDLRIKFMDSGNNLIYQTPPVLFAKIADLMTKTQSSVDTKV